MRWNPNPYINGNIPQLSDIQPPAYLPLTKPQNPEHTTTSLPDADIPQIPEHTTTSLPDADISHISKDTTINPPYADIF